MPSRGLYISYVSWRESKHTVVNSPSKIRKRPIEPDSDTKMKVHVKIHPRKLTWHWKITIDNRRYIFKWLFYHCNVSFRGCSIIVYENRQGNCSSFEFGERIFTLLTFWEVKVCSNPLLHWQHLGTSMIVAAHGKGNYGRVTVVSSWILVVSFKVVGLLLS